MEGKDMAGPENLRRGIFPIRTPQRERTAAPVLPRPEARPTPEFPEHGKPPKTRKKLGAKARIALASLAVAGAVETTGAVITEQTNEQPISTHTVIQDAAWPWNLGKSAAEDIAGMLHKEPPSVFDNSAVKGKISLANILSIPKEVFDKTPLADENGNPIFDFPWDKNNPVEIKYTKSLWPQPDWWKSDVDPKTEIKNNFEATTTLPAGYEFTTPYPGRLFFAGSVYNEKASRKSLSNPYGLAVYDGPIHVARIEFVASDGILYYINIGIHSDKGNVILEPLTDAPLTDAPLMGLDDRETLVERGQKIFRTTKEGKLSMIIDGRKNGSFLAKDLIPGSIKFQTGKNSNGVEKLLVSETK